MAIDIISSSETFRTLPFPKLVKRIREDVLTMLCVAGSGHTGGALSCVEILATLFCHVMSLPPLSATDVNVPHDYFILSKGHGCPTLYSILARLGYFPIKDLLELRTIFGQLQGHPRRKFTPGIEVSTGSLGQGLSVGVGIALGLKLNQDPNRVFVVTGDGELQSGQIWEAAMCASHYELDNLVVIVDNNDLQIDGRITDVMNIYPLYLKFQSFGWETFSVDGHDFVQLKRVLQYPRTHHRPLCVIAKTVKGKGVSFMENRVKYHGVAPTYAEYIKALEELNGKA